ncbi:unnamed protein product [Effrenium voratum]|nr:unnamed protein product [Effrenium voratum]
MPSWPALSSALIEWHRKRRGGPKGPALERNDSADGESHFVGSCLSPSSQASPLHEAPPDGPPRLTFADASATYLCTGALFLTYEHGASQYMSRRGGLF